MEGNEDVKDEERKPGARTRWTETRDRSPYHAPSRKRPSPDEAAETAAPGSVARETCTVLYRFPSALPVTELLLLRVVNLRMRRDAAPGHRESCACVKYINVRSSPRRYCMGVCASGIFVTYLRVTLRVRGVRSLKRGVC